MTDTTDLATVDEEHQPPAALRTLLPARDETHRIWSLAQQLQHTEFVPQAMQGRPDKILAAVLAGREMGVPPMRSLQHINIIEGQAQPSAELHLAQALKAGHRLEVVETTRERCTVEVHRADWPDDKPARTLTWELEDAVQAGLCQIKDGKPYARSKHKNEPLPWEKFPRAMLRARAITEACRTWLPDAIEGLDYLPPVEPDGPAPVATVEAADGSTHSVDAVTGELVGDSAPDTPSEDSGGDPVAEADAAGEEDELEATLAQLVDAGDDIDVDMWREKASGGSVSRNATIRTLQSRLDKLNTTHGPANEADQDGGDGGRPEFPFDDEQAGQP